MVDDLIYFLRHRYLKGMFLIQVYNHYFSLIYIFLHFVEFQPFALTLQRIQPMERHYGKKDLLIYLSQNPQYQDLAVVFLYSL